MRIVRDLPYSATHSETRVLDLYLPDGNGNGRCILWIHGGGWRGGRRASWRRPAALFCGEGYVCASADYRLAPAWRFPCHVDDVRLAMAYARTRADDLGFRADNIAAIGSSAGAHLVSMLATTGLEDCAEGAVGDTRPNAVVAISTPTTFMDTDAQNEKLRPHLEHFLGCTLSEDPQRYKTASPLERVSGAEPPFLLLHGDEDPLIPLSHSLRMRDKLLAAGVHAELAILSGAKHGFPYGIDSPHQQETIAHVRRFLDQVFTGR